MRPVLSILLLFVVSNALSQSITISGTIVDTQSSQPLGYANVIIKKDSAFVKGTVAGEDGEFILRDISPGTYELVVSYAGYVPSRRTLYVGSASPFLREEPILLTPDQQVLDAVTVSGQREAVQQSLDRKTFQTDNNLVQSGGTALQFLQTLPGVTVEDGKLLIRGSDKVAVLVDGQQTALTGFGHQESLQQIPASAIEKIEIIHNPAARYDANGNAGIVNIIFKKNNNEGTHIKGSLSIGAGALWIKEPNLPGVAAQYQRTPKLNPSLSLNKRTKNHNTFLQADWLYTPTLNKNEMVTRTYDDGTIIRQQTRRNRDTDITTLRAGHDWVSGPNSYSASALFSSEKILDHGQEPFFNADLSSRLRLWQFLEDEVKTTATLSQNFKHAFTDPGHSLQAAANYTFHREDERYFFTNVMPTFTGNDSFKLLSDEHVIDITADYFQPLAFGRLEAGLKYRWRYIPTNMDFYPGTNSPLDVSAGGWADYREVIPAVYATYAIEKPRWELEAGSRLEHVDVNYQINPAHPTYKSDGYSYLRVFPNIRAAIKFSESKRLSLFYNQRVDRPNEFDLRVFPKYDDAEIIKVGNPGLRPQFTSTIELGYKSSLTNGYLYGALYHRIASGTLTRIASTNPPSTLIYNVMQNAGTSYNSGFEFIWANKPSRAFNYTLNINVYRNQINSFSVVNLYPISSLYQSEEQVITSGSIKWNGFIQAPGNVTLQFTATYLAPDIIPQGRIEDRYSVDAGARKTIQKGRGELIVNATDLLNTLNVRRTIQASGFRYVSNDYYETQVVRITYGYTFK